MDKNSDKRIGFCSGKTNPALRAGFCDMLSDKTVYAVSFLRRTAKPSNINPVSNIA
jgi:hypothetical protein